MAIFNADDFPIHALPTLLRDAVLDLHAVTKAPIPIAVSSVLAALSLAISGRYRVKRFNGVVTGLALFLLVIASSGERKTSCDKLAMRQILKFDAELVARWQKAFEAYQAEMSVWTTECGGAKAALKRVVAAGMDSEWQKKQLIEILVRKPNEPLLRSLIVRDITPEALIQRLSAQPTLGVVCNEAAALLGGKTFNNLGLLNITWESGMLSVDRKNQAPLVVQDPNLTLSVMVQPGPLQLFMEKKGDQARNNGFFARCLVCRPISTMGQRFEYETTEILTEGLDRFQTKVIEHLDAAFGEDCDLNVEKRLLQFEFSAKERAREYTNLIEFNLQPKAHLADVRDAASKIADNMARLAGLFHLCDAIDESDEIRDATVQQACLVSDWYLNSFKCIFAEQNVVPVWQQDAEMLRKFLVDMATRQNCWQFRHNDARQHAPYRLRNQRFTAALHVLNNLGGVRLFYVGKVRWIEVMR